jgi:hypothetical protein
MSALPLMYLLQQLSSFLWLNALLEDSCHAAHVQLVVDDGVCLCAALESLLPAKTHRRAATSNTKSREAPRTAGGPWSLGQRPAKLRHMSWLMQGRAT